MTGKLTLWTTTLHSNGKLVGTCMEKDDIDSTKAVKTETVYSEAVHSSNLRCCFCFELSLKIGRLHTVGMAGFFKIVSLFLQKHFQTGSRLLLAFTARFKLSSCNMLKASLRAGGKAVFII